MIMCRNRKKRAVRMLNLTYPQARLDCSYFKSKDGYNLRGRIRGFTLVELLIVIAIISIAALTAIPMMSSAASMQIRSAANLLTADLEYAKSMAISRAQNFSVIFDAGADTYRIEDQYGNVLSHPVKKGFNYVIDFQNDGRLKKVDILSVDFDSTSKITFDYLGSPYNGIHGPLNNGVINLQAGSTTSTITVEPVTGYVSIQ
jgi:prepilin-type N-terminal cleavage/methylation domain-containing protein